MKFIDPRIDFAFKKIFGSEDTKDILISFLESLLGLTDDKRIREISIIDPFLAPKIKDLKMSVLDVRCLDYRGISYIVEMQVKKVRGFLKRIQYNASKTYVNQIGKGEDYPKLNQVIAVTITDFILFEDIENCITCHITTETETGNRYLNEIIYYFIELPKFKKEIREIENHIDKWIWFIRYASEIKDIPEELKEEVFMQAFEKARIANMNKEELEYYDKAGIAVADERGAIELALEEGEKRGIEKGFEKGMEQGIEKGMEQGIEKGIAKGMVLVARNLLAENKSYEYINKITGLSIEIIEKISEGKS